MPIQRCARTPSRSVLRTMPLLALLFAGCTSDDGSPGSSAAGGVPGISTPSVGGSETASGGASSSTSTQSSDVGGSSAPGSGGTSVSTGQGSSLGGNSNSGGSSVGGQVPMVGGRSGTTSASRGGTGQGGTSAAVAQGGFGPGSAQGGRSSRAQGGAAGRGQGGASGTTTRVATGGSTPTTVGTAGSGSSGLSAFAQEAVDAHNAVRSAVTQPTNYVGTWVPIPNVTWSDTVAASAQQWADHLRDTQNCGLVHEGSGTGYGENLAAGTNLTVTQAVNMWAGEASKYTWSAKYTTADFNAGSGHYTQVVWRKSTTIGCGSASCGKTIVISCRYSPPGNVTGGTQSVY